MPRTTILLLETDDLTVTRMTENLRKAHYEVIQSGCFRDAFQALKTQANDLALVILDFELATDDVDILARLRKLDFDRPLPVVLMGQVQLSDPEIQQLALDSGYAGYICKSMSDSEILEKISSLALQDDERRAAVRVYYHTRVHGVFNQHHFVADTYTLSVGGAFLRLKDNFPELGATGTVTFNGAIQGKMTLQVEAEVVYHRAFDPQIVSIHPSGIGIKFINLSEESLRLLTALVEYQAELGKITQVS